jgi:hypothetical protein|tara:strand:+ start:3015 stop:3224 length:210 start_codon:yes stop_codon:yes gene_type:complete
MLQVHRQSLAALLADTEFAFKSLKDGPVGIAVPVDKAGKAAEAVLDLLFSDLLALVHELCFLFPALVLA